VSQDPIRHHIEAAAVRTELDTRRLTSRIVGLCWPGGAEDRTERVALDWVRRWSPASAGAMLPVCSCARGNCVVCN
jgi:hypothetical protein